MISRLSPVTKLWVLCSMECVGFFGVVFLVFPPPVYFNRVVWTHSLKVDVTCQNHTHLKNPNEQQQKRARKTVIEVIEEKNQSFIR